MWAALLCAIEVYVMVLGLVFWWLLFVCLAVMEDWTHTSYAGALPLELCPQPLLLNVFSNSVLLYACWLGMWPSYLCAPLHIAGMTGEHHCALSLVEMGGLANFLPRLALNHSPPNLHLPSSWGYRLEHCAWLSVLNLSKIKENQKESVSNDLNRCLAFSFEKWLWGDLRGELTL
jgi:hypothetical protein